MSQFPIEKQYQANAPHLDKIIYSTTVSGNGWDYGYGIAVDNAGRAYVVGNTNAHDFPTTAGSAEKFLMGVADAFLFRIGTLQTTMVKSKYCRQKVIFCLMNVVTMRDGAAYANCRGGLPVDSKAILTDRSGAGNLAN